MPHTFLASGSDLCPPVPVRQLRFFPEPLLAWQAAGTVLPDMSLMDRNMQVKARVVLGKHKMMASGYMGAWMTGSKRREF